MKQNILLYITGILMSLACLQACTKDSSTLDINKIQGVKVDTSGIGTIEVYQFDVLELTPHIDAGDLSDDNFSYEWKITLLPNDTMYQVLSTEKNLKTEIKLRPTSVTESHRLVLTITDQRNGLRYITPYQVKILNNIGEGLVIADSRDGAHSDIHHLMMPWVTTNYAGESLKRNVFSSINGKLIDGIVKQMRSFQFGRDQVVQGITDNSIFNIKKLDYTMLGIDNELFYAPHPTYKPQALGAVWSGDLYVDGGTLTAAYMKSTFKFPNTIDSKFTIPSILGMSQFQNSWVVLNFYDEVNECFVYQKTVVGIDKALYKHPQTAGAAFDPSNLPGQVNVAAGMSPDMDFLHLLKDKTTGKIRLYVFGKGTTDGAYITFPPSPKQVIDFSDAPGIATAHHFVFADDQRVLYYVSGNKVYAALFGTSTLTVQERYTLPAGAEVTELKIYQQAEYPAIDATIPTNNKVLIMATYEGEEGKLTLFPMLNLGIGNLDIVNRKEYTGFGRISAVAPQR